MFKSASHRMFHKNEVNKTCVFTIVGHQVSKPDNKSIVKRETSEHLPKTVPRDKSEGTIFGVLGSPKSRYSQQIKSSQQKTSDHEKSDNNLQPSKLFQKRDESGNIKSNANINKKEYKNITVSVNEKINFRLSVPQELPIQLVKEFCQGMIENNNSDANNHKESADNCNTKDEKYKTSILISENNANTTSNESKNILSTLKSPVIVKEVMKRMAGIPRGGFKQDVKINVTEFDANTDKNQENMTVSPANSELTSNDREAMLAIQELDRSIAEGSPSNANSPLILRSNEKNQQQNEHNSRQTLQQANANLFRPSKPPRIASIADSINAKRDAVVTDYADSQTENLIEEVYLTNKNCDARTENKTVQINNTTTTRKKQDCVNQREKIALFSSENSDNNLSNGNVNAYQYKLTDKKESAKACELDTALIAGRASLSSVDSGMSSHHLSHFIVVAIDFGTTYSGYAFSFTRDPHNIHMMRKVEGCDPDVNNQKIPTILLLNSDGAFHSFGFAARDFYHSLQPKHAKHWFYFEKFKMNLHYNESLTLETQIKTSNGNKCLSALTVFAHALRYFKLLALQELSDQMAIDIQNDDIRWVITVPAIWKPSAKQFMRAAAYEAGIGSPENYEQLLIALEPEAASIYCRKLRTHQLVPECPPQRHSLLKEKNDIKSDELALISENEMNLPYYALNCQYNETIENEFSKGTKYIVVDAGGGTVDITVHEIQNKQGSLKELHKATGGPHGSIGIDFGFEKLMSDIFGNNFMEQFKLKRPSGYVDLMAAFEARKRSASPHQNTTYNISLPFSFINFYKKCKSQTVETAVKKYSASKGVTYCPKLGMIRIEPLVMQKLFKPVTNKIISHIRNVLDNNLVRNVGYLILVGGFAESQILQFHIRKAFNASLKVIIPQSPNLAILRGATIYGIDPTVICCRRSPLTYGVGILNRFVCDKHPKEKLIVKDRTEWCTDVFDKFVTCDQSIGLFETITRSYAPLNDGQKCCVIHIYSSDKDDTMFITDAGVMRCGTLYLDLDHQYIAGQTSSHKIREIQTQMTFGDTEIKVTAIDMATRKCVRAQLDFLNV